MNEEYEENIRVPAGVVFMGGKYVAVVPQVEYKVRDINQKYDAFCKGVKVGIGTQVEKLLDEMSEKAEGEA